MDIRSKLSLNSTWEESAQLNRLLRVVNSSGVIMDEPYASERAEVILVQPASTEDGARPLCYINIDSSHLRGYFLGAIELISASRTVELYSSPDHDYISTARGSLMEKKDDGGKIYSTQFELPTDLQSTTLSLKLLSLQGRTEVLVKEINMIVSEDHGGIRPTGLGQQSDHSGSEPTSSGTGLDLQQLLQSVGVSQNVPPLLKSLASSLQMLQLQQHHTPSTNRENATPSTSGAGGVTTSLPVELTQMMDALKMMRPPSPHTTATDQPGDENEKGDGERTSEQEEAINDEVGEQVVNEVVTKLLDERLSALETRLIGYVDLKLAELGKKLLSEVGNLSQRVDKLYQTRPDSEHCHVSNGTTLSLPLSADHQLD